MGLVRCLMSETRSDNGRLSWCVPFIRYTTLEDVINDILPMMKRILVLLMFCLTPAANAAEEALAVLGAEFWFEPRHGDAIAEHEGVRGAVKKLIAEPEAYLALRYPATEFGELWGLELQAWLVSLGLVSDRIELQSGFDQLEAVELVVISPDVEGDEALQQVDEISAESSESEMNAPVQGGAGEQGVSEDLAAEKVEAPAQQKVQEAVEEKVGAESQ